MKFTAEDFESIFENYECAKIANSKLQSWLESAPMVTGWIDDNGGYVMGTLHDSRDTIAARLVEITTIKKCEHPVDKLHFPLKGLRESLLDSEKPEPVLISEMYLHCECGAKLRAKWEAVK